MAPPFPELTRREALHIVGGLAGTALLGGCGNSGNGGTDTDGAVEPLDGRNTCVVYPQETEGPYYLDLDLLRGDITEGKPGTSLSLTIRVLGTDGCVPIKDLAVDIWHCDASGVYSGYPGQLGGLDTTGQKFLRGTQVTDSDGRVQFETVYPGWYPGRTTHVHFKVHRSSTAEATSQMYFPESLTSAIYQTSPYSTHGQKDTSNESDSVARTGGLPPLVALTAQGTGYVATLTVTLAA